MQVTDDARPETIGELAEKLRTFAEDRDWQQFHTPKNLAMALAGEVGELLAEFQWLEVAPGVQRISHQGGPREATGPASNSPLPPATG